MRRVICLLLMLLVCASACAETPDVQENPVMRVVSLYGSYAEAWQLAGGTLAGVTEDAVSERGMDLGEHIQIIGTVKEPNLELVIALEPDLVLLSADIASHAAAAQTLEAAGIPCRLLRVDTFTDFAGMMDEFTLMTGRRDIYEELIPPMQAQIDALVARAAAQEHPTVLLLRAFSTGVRVKGRDNLAGVMLEEMGCVNIADRQPSLLEEVTLEAIVAENPEYVLISIMGADIDAALQSVEQTLGQNPAWQALDAVQAGRVYVLPKELFHYKPNTRWGESYAYLAHILYGW